MRPVRDPAAGVTLIEVLVVLAIIAVMAGVTTLGLGSVGQAARAETEASRLADRLQLAADEGMVAGAPLAFLWDDFAYRFVAWDGNDRRWRPSALGDLGSRHTMPSGLQLAAAEAVPRRVLISPNRPQPVLALAVTDGEGAWRVAFDGLTARVLDGGEADALR